MLWHAVIGVANEASGDGGVVTEERRPAAPARSPGVHLACPWNRTSERAIDTLEWPRSRRSKGERFPDRGVELACVSPFDRWQ